LATPEDSVNKYQRKAWEFFEKGIKKYSSYDVVFVNGDAIDGLQKKSGGKELITTDLEEQCDIAIRVLKRIVELNGYTPSFYFTRGTPYHTGDSVDFENFIAKAFPNKNGKQNINETLLVKIDGVVFDLKHKVGGSNLIQGKGTAPLRDVASAVLREVTETRARADVFIRSHTHSHIFIEFKDRTVIVTPALQMWSSYGARQCGGVGTDFGFITCEVDNGQVTRWNKYINSTAIVPEEIIVHE
jgi:hypothetical protein